MLQLRYAEDCKLALGNTVLRRFAHPLARYFIAASDILGSSSRPPCVRSTYASRHARLLAGEFAGGCNEPFDL